MKLSQEELEKMDAWIDQELYLKGIQAGEHFFAAYQTQEKGMSQVRNLQTKTLQATRFMQIESFIKNQIGKENNNQGWLFYQNNAQLGFAILEDFQAITKKAEEMATDNYEKKCEIRKQMVKAYVEALVAQFCYCRKVAV